MLAKYLHYTWAKVMSYVAAAIIGILVGYWIASGTTSIFVMGMSIAFGVVLATTFVVYVIKSLSVKR